MDHDLVLRDLQSLDPSDLLRPAVLAGICELPEQRRRLYHAWLAKKLDRLDEAAGGMSNVMPRDAVCLRELAGLSME